MKIRIWFALAKSVVLECIRKKDIWVVVIIGLLIVLAASLLGMFGFSGLEVFAKDLAATVLSAASAIVAILVSARMLPDEIRYRTLYPLLARPISRFDLFFGKLLGSVLVTWIAFGALCTVIAFALLLFGVKFEPIMIEYVFLKAIGLALMCAVTMTLSMFMTQPAAASVSFILAFGSAMFIRSLTMAYAASGGGKAIFATVNALLPQYGLFDISGRAAASGYGLVPLWAVGALLVYAILYGGAMIYLGCRRFDKKAI